MKKGKVLVLRTCNHNLTSSDGFVWPQSGPVEAPDWNPDPSFDRGLYGLLWGAGDGDQLNWAPYTKWLLVEVDADSIIDLGDKVKFPRGTVVYCGEKQKAIQYLLDSGADPSRIVGHTIIKPDQQSATVADYGTAIVGNDAVATSGKYGTSIAGLYGTAIAGDFGTAFVLGCGRAEVGDYGLAIVGESGTVSAGKKGIIITQQWDAKSQRMRVITGYIGESNLEPYKPYRLLNNKFTEVNTETKRDTSDGSLFFPSDGGFGWEYIQKSTKKEEK